MRSVPPNAVSGSDPDSDIGSIVNDDCEHLDDAIAHLHDLAGMLGVRVDTRGESEDGPRLEGEDAQGRSPGGTHPAPGGESGSAMAAAGKPADAAPVSLEGALSGSVDDLAAMIDALLKEGAAPPPAPTTPIGGSGPAATVAIATAPATRGVARPPGEARQPQDPPATPTSTGGAPAVSAPPPRDDDAARTAELARELALADLDRELADGVDSIIDGSFESVTRLLDQIFDASVVSPDEDEAAAEAIAFEIEAGALLADESFAPGGLEAHASGIDVEVDAPESGEGRPGEPPAAGPGAAGPWMDDDAAPSIDLLGEVVEAATADIAARADDLVTPTAGPGAPRSEGPSGGVSAEPACPPTGSGPVDARPAPPQRSRSDDRCAARRPSVALTSLLVSMLVALSAPLRLVPPAVRPVVDWLAISLALWAPIVWLAVLLKG